MSNEPIFWTTTTPGYNDRDRQRWIVVDGKRVKEKFPQRGHVGTYDDKKPAPGDRWMLVVRHDGHEVRAVLTNGAAHLDTNTAYAQYVKVKGYTLGWYSPFACPSALVAAGNLRADMCISSEALSKKPCEAGTYGINPQTGEGSRCTCSKAEQKARQARQHEEHIEKEGKSRSENDKVLEALREQTKALTERVSPAPAAVAPDPPRRKGGE